MQARHKALEAERLAEEEMEKKRLADAAAAKKKIDGDAAAAKAKSNAATAATATETASKPAAKRASIRRGDIEMRKPPPPMFLDPDLGPRSQAILSCC